MSLIQFEDLPSTNTPLNANNLNNNFGELDIRTKVNSTTELDLNNITDTGTYYLGGNSSAINHPDAGMAGWLIVLNYNNGGRVKQIWTRFTSGRGVVQTWMRVGNDVNTQTPSWYPWYRVLAEDTGWVNITQSNLAQGTVGTGYYVPAYRRVGNIVYLKGQINGVTSRATEIFTLPSGYYNSDNRHSFCTTNDNTETNFVRITNTGIVVLQRSTGNFTNGVNVYLDGISFVVD